MMAVASFDYLAFVESFIDNTEPGSSMLLQDVSWDEYDRYLQAVDEKRHARFSYDEGRLEIRSLSFERGIIVGLFPALIFVLADECGMNFRGAGSTTLRLQAKAKGTNPDDSYYFQNLSALRGLKQLDLTKTPPPDLVLEIDLANPSLDKLPIYAALGVPELWLHTGMRLQFFRLTDGAYVEISYSDLFPFLPTEVLLHHFQQGELTDTIAAAESFRTWIKDNRSTTNSK